MQDDLVSWDTYLLRTMRVFCKHLSAHLGRSVLMVLRQPNYFNMVVMLAHDEVSHTFHFLHALAIIKLETFAAMLENPVHVH